MSQAKRFAAAELDWIRGKRHVKKDPKDPNGFENGEYLLKENFSGKFSEKSLNFSTA